MIVFVTGSQKINHIVTFVPQNIFTSNNTLHNTNQHCSTHRISLFREKPKFLWNILIAACILLWQQPKVPGSLYFMHEKVINFLKSSHILHWKINNGKTNFITTWTESDNKMHWDLAIPNVYIVVTCSRIYPHLLQTIQSEISFYIILASTCMQLLGNHFGLKMSFSPHILTSFLKQQEH